MILSFALLFHSITARSVLVLMAKSKDSRPHPPHRTPTQPKPNGQNEIKTKSNLAALNYLYFFSSTRDFFFGFGSLSFSCARVFFSQFYYRVCSSTESVTQWAHVEMRTNEINREKKTTNEFCYFRQKVFASFWYPFFRLVFFSIPHCCRLSILCYSLAGLCVVVVGLPARLPLKIVNDYFKIATRPISTWWHGGRKGLKVSQTGDENEWTGTRRLSRKQ